MGKNLELPEELNNIEITFQNDLGIGEVIMMQTPAKFYDGKWHINLFIVRPGMQLRLTNGDGEEVVAPDKHRPAG